MTDFASLNIKIDSSEAGNAVSDLNALTTAGGAAEQSATGLASAWTKADIAASALGKGTAEAKAEINGLKASLSSGAISQGQYETGLINTRAALSGLQQQHRSALSDYTAASHGLNGVTASAGAQRAGMQQLSYQIGDVSQQFALGVNPMIIFAQQGGQVIQALSLMKGGATGLIGFLARPWGTVIMGAVTVAGLFASKLLATSDAMDDVKFASSAVGNAQNILGNVMNITTGKINTQSSALLALARAQLLVAKVQSVARAADARRGVQALQDRPIRVTGYLMNQSVGRRPVGAQDSISRDVLSGSLDPGVAVGRLDNLRKVGVLSDNQFAQGASAVANLAVETANQRVYDEGLKLLNGTGGGSLLKSGGGSQGRASGIASGRSYGLASGNAAGTSFMEAFLKEMAGFQEKTFETMVKGIVNSNALRNADWASQVLDAQDDIKSAQKERTQGAIDEAEAMARLNDQLKDTVNRLDQLGGIGSTLGNIGAFGLAIKTGDYSGVRGPVGYAAQSLLTTTDKDGNRSLNEYGRRLETMFTKIFGDNGKFTKLLEAAGTGAAIGSILFGQNNKAAQTGGAIGSVAGSLIPGLPPGVGSAIGSIIGSTIGSLFKKSPTGSASVTNGNVTGGGNNADAKSATSGIAGAVSGSLSNIANQLGGTVGSYGYAVGMRNDYYRVSGTAGADTTSKKAGNLLYDGKDPAEAARIALLNAIQDGAIKGIREGAQRLLQAGTDLNAQVAKALKFQGVFDDLKKSTDPLGFALDTLTKKFDDLRTIFTEAGASAADYASLEQLLAVQRTEALDQARRDAVDKVRGPYELQVRILELLGNKEDALAASRILEIAGLKGTLQPLQAMIYQLEDARKVIDTFTPLADSLKAFRGDLLGNQSAGGLGYVTDKFRAAAMGAANGDATSMGSLQGTATAFLEATKQSAETELDYRRAVGEVLASVDKGIFAAETQIDYAQAQIDAVNNSANILAAMRAEMAILQKQIVDNTGLTARLFTRFDADGLTVKTATDTPISVKVVT